MSSHPPFDDENAQRAGIWKGSLNAWNNVPLHHLDTGHGVVDAMNSSHRLP